MYPYSPKHLSPKEASYQLGLSTRTVLKRIREGQIYPVYRINARVIRIPQEAIDEYLDICLSKRSPPELPPPDYISGHSDPPVP